MLDGQQQLTALARVVYDGDPDIRFNLDTERFEVANAAIRRDAHWRPVTDIFSKRASRVARERDLIRDGGAEAEEALGRLNRVAEIKKIIVPAKTLLDFDH